MYGTVQREHREFKVVLRDGMDAQSIEARLNELGREGWSLDGTVCTDGYTTMFILGRNASETSIVLNERKALELDQAKHLA